MRDLSDPCFAAENEMEGYRKEYLSPSGRFRLVTRLYKSLDGYISPSRGTVYRVSDGVEVADLCRNYSVFHHSFITKKGHEYLITGRSYMGQTIINLDTGEKWDNCEEKQDAKEEQFCWADSWLSPDETTLLVYGCYWACPYEYRWYDFTDLSKGWPELELTLEDGYDNPYSDGKFKWDKGSDTIIEFFDKWYKPLDKEYNDVDRHEEIEQGDAWKNPDNWEERLKSKYLYVRENNKIVMKEKWLSPQEEADRKASKERQAKFDAMVADFKANNPDYKTVIKFAEENKLERDKWLGWRAWANNEVNIRFNKIGITLSWELSSDNPYKVSWYEKVEEKTTKVDKTFDRNPYGLLEALSFIRESSTAKTE